LALKRSTTPTNNPAPMNQVGKNLWRRPSTDVMMSEPGMGDAEPCGPHRG
jgi:hypothetical protein